MQHLPDIQASDFVHRGLIRRTHEKDSFLFQHWEETLGELRERVLHARDNTVFETLRIGSIVGAIEMLIVLGTEPNEIIRLGRIYVVRHTEKEIAGIQLLEWDLDAVVECFESLWEEDVQEAKRADFERIIEYVRRILASLVKDFGEEPVAKETPMSPKG